MQRKAQSHNSIFGIAWNSVLALMLVLLVLIVGVLFIIFTAQPAHGQTYKVIYSFTWGKDGAIPGAGLTIDAAGNLYGTTSWGGSGYPGYGTVFQLKHSGSAWVLATLYSFAGGGDGGYPYSRVVFGPDGSLYGTSEGGRDAGAGTVFKLQPSATACKTATCPWTETVLYRFTGSGDGAAPLGDLIFDKTGNIYGTASGGGNSWCSYGCGVIYELMPSGGSWTQTVLFSPQSPSDGFRPVGGVLFDPSGNLYGGIVHGGPFGDQDDYGTLYQLSPSGSSWTEQTLHAFTGSDGSKPAGALILDPSGNLYGTTNAGGTGGGGTVFELTPGNGGWIFDTLYAIPGVIAGGPLRKLIMDAAGNLYGTTYYDGAYGYGSVFKLTRSNGGWTYTSLHDFDGADGADPMSSVVFDANGNLYGTAAYYGPAGNGVVWEITP